MPVPQILIKPLRAGLISALLLALDGCSSTLVMPHDGPDIKEVYDRHMGGQKGNDVWAASATDAQPNPHQDPGLAPQPLTQKGEELEGYSRSGSTEIEQLFPQLPNPQVVMYVFPHRGTSGLPIPGYMTAFRLYDKNEYALPGEWISDAPSSDPSAYVHLPKIAPVAPASSPSTGSTDQFADPSNKPAR